jgi:hypothetical protein
LFISDDLPHSVNNPKNKPDDTCGHCLACCAHFSAEPECCGYNMLLGAESILLQVKNSGIQELTRLIVAGGLSRSAKGDMDWQLVSLKCKQR